MLEFNDGSCVCGTVKVGERGQIVIPKKAREQFGIEPGDSLVVLGDAKRGLTLFKAANLQEFAAFLMDSSEQQEK